MTDGRQLPPLPPLPISTEAVRKSHGFDSAAHWVVPGALMQGSRPGFGLGGGEEAALRDRARALVRDGGCRAFVSLQAECAPEEGSVVLGGGGDRKPKPKDLPGYAAHVAAACEGAEGGGGSGSAAPAFLYYGIVGMETAKSVESLSEAVDDLASRIKAGETIYVHCGGGMGRAGLVVACLLGALYEDLDAEAALEYTTSFSQLRIADGEEVDHCSSPETEGQKEQVRQFFRRLRAG
ncbi:hypothetical protein ACHAWF_009369 [Thalassiosira exigua]